MHISFEKSGFSGTEALVASRHLEEYLRELSGASKDKSYATHESVLHFPYDTEIIGRVRSVVFQKTSKSLKYVLVLGIGGSNLGAKAVYEAIRGRFYSGSEHPSALFLDTPDERSAKEILNKITLSGSAEEFLVFIISKSGDTMETIAGAEYVLYGLKKRFPDVKDRVIVVTERNSVLAREATGNRMEVFNLPGSLTGRFSVLSPAGLLPLCALGIDIDALVSGACEMGKICVSLDADKNLALRGAGSLSRAISRGVSISDIFLFNPDLESLGKWYRQLLAESTGKNETVAITPTVSIGTTDLHSVAQRTLAGQKNIFTLFVSSEPEDLSQVTVPEERFFKSLLPDISGKRLSSFVRAILEGVKNAYKTRGLYFTEVNFSGVTERELGMFLQWKMAETMLLGKLLSVDVFNQPAVESYKREARKLLEYV